jgi:hypothetical protein
VQLACSALSFALVIRDLAGSAGTGRDRSCTARVFPSCSHLRRRADPASSGKLIDLCKGEVSAGRIVKPLAEVGLDQRQLHRGFTASGA